MTSKLSAQVRNERFAADRGTPLDWGIVAAGPLALGFSFIDYYTVSVNGSTHSTGAWHGFFGWFGCVAAAVAAAILGTGLVASRHKPRRLYPTVATLFAVASVCEFAALFTSGYVTSRIAEEFGVKVDSGHGYGYWASFVLCIAATVAALLRVRRTGSSPPAD